jgi:uncharacterized protein (TIGR02246 family)
MTRLIRAGLSLPPAKEEIMKKTLTRVVCAAGAVLAVVIGIAAQSGDVKAQIDKANEAFMAAFAKGDTAAIAAMYTTDGQALPPNTDVVRGRDAIKKLWDDGIAMGVKSVKLKATEVEAHGNVAHEVGTYAVLSADGTELDRGKYIVIWKREGNTWKLHRDIWNTSKPAAQ